jgi:hypothetical protein
MELPPGITAAEHTAPAVENKQSSRESSGKREGKA